ncbi:hypothetical protein SAMN05444004_10888 [Jannaschia faecimaris]|uniref:Uncharacterized protein n=1 Tax=Jannaschia faecimaris TaxID=1244108 RepID=A0A1H3RGT3_9RHOB|nr:hypothetical protein [Jannaschia faecimaris]SDZ24139.1 hypothetical protein SAMN05444004_10888 [Jannaschia faecimaris]
MAALIWVGAALTAVGLTGLIICIIVAARARASGLEGVEMETRLRKLVALNLGALAVSALGLMCVVIGVLLG